MRWIAISALTVIAACAQDTNVMYVRSGAAGMKMEIEGKTVTGAPYSAQAVTETTQVLADGNRITRKSTSFVARDSAGRTRREQTLDAVGPWATGNNEPPVVTITDPVAGTNVTLETNAHVAFKAMNTGMNQQVRVDLEAKMKAERKVVVAGQPEARANVESLGSQTIEGVQVEGKRVTEVIPAGKIGNDRPINVVNETWYSPELQTVVMSKHSDPRSGDVTYQLTNISRTEPDPALFQVPSGYEMKEPQTVTIRSVR